MDTKRGWTELRPFLGADGRLTDTVGQKNLVFQVGYMYRYNPAVRRALDWIRAGRIGDVLCVEAQMNQCYSGAMLDWLATIPGGMMGYLGANLPFRRQRPASCEKSHDTGRLM